jgi:hypothetical protein
MGGNLYKQTQRKMKNRQYAQDFYALNKEVANKKSMIKYYASSTSREDVEEMMNGYGIDETLRLLKIKKQEDKLSAMVCF